MGRGLSLPLVTRGRGDNRTLPQDCDTRRGQAMAAAAAKAYSKLTGALFGQFKMRKDLLTRHWLDTNTNQYYETLERIVIPECMNIASDVPGYPERIHKLLSYTNPAFSDVWNFNIELIYRTVADKGHQTEENITKMYLLRAIMDLMFTESAVLDDCSDVSEYRLGKKSWHAICPGGPGAAIYDGAQIGMLPFFILKQHFRSDPGYLRMMELIAMIGQTIDVLGHAKSVPSMDDYKHINYYKAGQFVSTGPGLALLHAGILSEELISKTMKVFVVMGELIQIWDDFNDYFSTSDQTGKPACDLQNGGTTWVSAIAIKNFNPSQVEEFKNCYGSSDPSKIKRVCELYDEIDMPSLYVEHMLKRYSICKAMINELPHEMIREASFSYLEWLVGQD